MKIIYMILMPLLIFGCEDSRKQQQQGKKVEKEKITHEQVAGWLKNDLQNNEALKCLPAGEKQKPLLHSIERFYELRDYRLAWTEEGEPTEHIHKLSKILNTAHQDGLDRDDYDLTLIEQKRKQLFDQKSRKDSAFFKKLVEFDILLTANYLTYASHLFSGRLNPQEVSSTWFVESKQKDLAEVLAMGLDSNNIEKQLNQLQPVFPGYDEMRLAYAYYNGVVEKGGWPKVPEGNTLEKGVRSDRVYILRKRLAASGDLPENQVNVADSALFDEAVENAVKNFQERHGLAVDGKAGAAVLAEMNVPAEERLEQIKLNLERMRWLPELKDRYLLVNVPEYKFHIYEQGKQVMEMRVVVGKEYNSTPIFSDEMEYVEVNPYWNVPTSIAVEEIIPKGADYITGSNMEVVDRRGRVVDPSLVTAENYGKYRIRQRPGSGNALGQIKFMFPNQYAIYLHDTPAGHLFSRDRRAYSHGCIRVHQPMDLAEYVLKGKMGREKVQAAIRSGRQQRINLPEKLPVHIFYFTAWADDQGRIHFRDDVYKHDKQQAQALKEWVNKCQLQDRQLAEAGN